jgi:hypothetical protein
VAIWDISAAQPDNRKRQTINKRIGVVLFILFSLPVS